MQGRLLLVTVLAGAIVAVAAAAPATAPTSARIVALINAERAANGIPPVTENPAYSADCHEFDVYAVRNGWDEPNAHQETPGKAGYTVAGDWVARRSILSRGGSWNGGDPWANAPLHLSDLMDPQLTEVGADETAGYDCAYVATIDLHRFQVPQVFTVPGDGAKRVPPSEVADELPATPDQLIGLTSSPTGPELLAYSVGLPQPGTVTLASASLTGPDGATVPVRTLDNRVPTSYLFDAAIVIPVHPLRGNARYTANVVFVDAGGNRTVRTWSFTTTPSETVTSAQAAVLVDIQVKHLIAVITTTGQATITLRLERVIKGATAVRTPTVGTHKVVLTRPTTRLDLRRAFGRLKPGYYELEWVNPATGFNGIADFTVRAG